MSSNTRVLHTAVWDYFSYNLSVRIYTSPNVVKEALMTDINDLVQEFWRTRDRAFGDSFFAMSRLSEILSIPDTLKVCFVIYIFET